LKVKKKILFTLWVKKIKTLKTEKEHYFVQKKKKSELLIGIILGKSHIEIKNFSGGFFWRAKKKKNFFLI